MQKVIIGEGPGPKHQRIRQHRVKRGGIPVERPVQQLHQVKQVEKRQPLLIDTYFNNPTRNYVRRDIDNKVRQRCRVAHRFVLDNDAIDRLAQVVREVPELIAKHQHFARAPFEVTWIEFDVRRFWTQCNPTKPPSIMRDDERVGWLIDGNRVYTISQGRPNNQEIVALCPMVFDLQQPASPEQQLDVARQIGMPEILTRGDGSTITGKENDFEQMLLSCLEMLFWGSSLDRLKENMEASQIDELLAFRGQHGFSFLPHADSWNDTKDVWRASFFEQASDLRNVIAMLLLLNRPSLTRYKQEVPRWRAFTKGKMRPFFDHNVITIDLDPTPTLRAIGTKFGDALPKRRHEVRGTWCHNRDAREYGRIVGCVHEWIVDADYPDDDPAHPDHYKCDVCGGKRWWRDQHERGDASIGWVKKDYSVTG